MIKTQNNKLFNFNDNHQLYLWFLFLLTIFITLVPFFKIGLTNCDDVEYYLKSFWFDTDRIAYAKTAGRFYFLITKPIYNLPYLIDNFYLTKVIQYGFVCLSFVLFAIVVKKIFKQTAFALTVFLLLFVFLTVTPNYFMPIIAFPLYFTLSFSIFLLSLLFFIKYYEIKKYKYLLFSAILFAMALIFYETFLIFLLFIVFFIIGKNISDQGIRFIRSKKFYKEIVLFVGTGVVYIVVYYLYRISVQSGDDFYAGSSLAKNFSLSNFFKIIWNLNRAAFPTYTYFRSQVCIESNSLWATGHLNNFWYIFKNSNAISIVNALIQCFLFCILSCKIKPDIPWKKIGFGALTAAAFIFAVHIILGISEKYNTVYYAMSGYVTTYYSYFCVTFFISLLAYSCIKLSYNNIYLKTAVIIVFTCLICWISIITGYSNDHLSRDWQHSRAKLIMMEEVIKEGVFDEIDDEAIIYMPNYNQTVSKLDRNLYSAFFWRYYVEVKTNRKLKTTARFETITQKLQENPNQDLFFITKYENQKSMDVLFVLSKVNNNSINFENEATIFSSATANEAKVYFYSANKNFVFQFFVPQTSPESTAIINNATHNVSCGINAIRIENEDKNKAVTAFFVKSDDPFFVKDFAISTMGSINE